MGTTYKYDTLPVAAIGTNVNLLDLLKQAYGDEVSNIRSLKIGYFNSAYMISQNFLTWDASGSETRVTGNANVPSIAGSSTDSSNYIPANLTTIDNAHFKDVTIEVGNSVMNTVHLQIEWSNDLAGNTVVQDLTVPTIPAFLQGSFIGHPGAPTPNDVVTAARNVANSKGGWRNDNDCDWIAKDIAAIAGATMDSNTWHPDNPALNEEGGFWRIAYRGSDPGQVKDWQTLVRPGDIVRMAWSDADPSKDGKPHTVTVTAGLNADGGHKNQIQVVDNGGKAIGEHWADFNSGTKAGSITIYRLTSNGLYLINGSSESDNIIGTVWNDYIVGGSGRDILNGGAGNDFLTGDDDNDVLDGGAGADKMHGGRGSDTYYVDNEGDVVSEAGVVDGFGVRDMGGTDEIVTTLHHRDLPSSGDWNGGDIENLTFNGTGSFSGSGNALNNVIRGGNGGNSLFGGEGGDSLYGGSVTDTLDGGSGADTIYGGGGDDTYIVDDRADVVSEFGSIFGIDAGGKDTIATTLSWYTLPKANVGWLDPAPSLGNIENLTYIGTGQFIGTGNQLDNTITGGAGQDTLDGGAGADTLIGKRGNDTYKVDNTADVIVENANEGYDIVKSTATLYTLRANVEELDYVGPGTANFIGTGNSLDNVIIGGGGHDTLDGGLGADTMYGGAGNDVYKVDSDSDVVVEGGFDASGKFIDFGGIDEIKTTKSLVMRTENGAFGNIENLTYIGTGKFTGTGNGLANVITGAAGADTLNGGGGKDTLIGSGGNDTLDGGAGIDTLTGGAGKDTFHFGDHWGTDIISDFKAAEGDIIDFRDLTGVSSLSQLHPADTTQGIQLTMGAGTDTNTITLNGVHTIQDSMFRFAFTQDDFTADHVSDILFHNNGNGDNVYYDIRNTSSHWTTIGTLPPLTRRWGPAISAAVTPPTSFSTTPRPATSVSTMSMPTVSDATGTTSAPLPAPGTSSSRPATSPAWENQKPCSATTRPAT